MHSQSSKYSLPRSNQTLHRERLIESIKSTRDKRLLLILGQAAQGKSTLAAQYFQNLSEPFIWINIGPEDADPINLFRVLSIAGESLVQEDRNDGVWKGAKRSFGPRELIPMYREWAEELYTNIPVNSEICLDGLERLGNNTPSLEFLKVLLKEAPRGIRYIILSRTMPPLAVEHLEMNREAFVLNNSDLAFQVQEIQAYFSNHIGKQNLPKKLANSLQHHLEGWVGGLVLYADLLAQGKISLDKLDTTGLDEHYTQKIFHYFAAQMLEELPSEIKIFLVKTSLFQVIEPEMASNLTGVKYAERILEKLVKRNLFIARFLDSNQAWLYRYHLLFRDFLRSKFKTIFSEEERKSIVIEAAGQLEKAGRSEEAVRLYLSNRIYPEAIPPLKTLGRSMLESGRVGELGYWLARIPQSLRKEDARLTLYWCHVHRYSSTFENVTLLNHAAKSMEAEHDTEGILLLRALQIEAGLVLGRIDEEALESGEQLLNRLSSEEHRLEQTELWLQIGFFHILRGDVLKGETACRRAYRLAKAGGIRELQINALIQGLNARIFLGDTDGIRTDLEKIRRLGVSEFPELLAMHDFSLALFMVFYDGLVTQAVTLMENTLRQIEERGLFYLYPAARYIYAVTLIYSDRIDEADALLNRCLAETQGQEANFISLVFTMFVGVGKYRSGQYLKALDFFEQVRIALRNGNMRADTHEICMEISLQMSRLSAGLPVEPDRLQAALRYFEKIKSPLLAAETKMAQALYHHSQNANADAATCLENAFKLVEEYGYKRFVMLSPTDVVQACGQALRLCGESVLKPVSRLLKEQYSEKAGPYLETLATSANRTEKERCRQILREIHLAGRPRIRVRTLGEFQVWRNDSLINLEEWGGIQPQLLLKALLSLGPRRASKDKLMDALWPDSSPEAAGRNFKTALHRLRRVLEPDLDRTFGSSYCTLKQNILSVTDLVTETDFEAFQHFATEGDRAEAAGRNRDALTAYQQAEELYTGGFLPDCVYFEWSRGRRDEINMHFVQMMLRKGQLHESRNAHRRAEHCYKRMIDMDPTNEEPYRRLMLLHASRGCKETAVKTYHAFRENLEKELGMPPGETVQAIYKKLIASETTS